MSDKHIVKLANLKPFQRGLTVDFKVIKTQVVRKVKSRSDGTDHQVADVLIGDQTGVLLLSVWDNDISAMETGKVFRLVNGLTSLFQGRLQLGLGRAGKLEPSPVTISSVNNERDLSAKSQPGSTGSRSQKELPEKRNPPERRSRGFMWTRVEPKSN